MINGYNKLNQQVSYWFCKVSKITTLMDYPIGKYGQPRSSFYLPYVLDSSDLAPLFKPIVQVIYMVVIVSF